MKKKSICLLIIIFLFSNFKVYAQTLSDIDHLPHKDAIEELVEEGIINGYHDNTFRPNEIVQRGQYVAFLARLLDLPSGTSTFTDLPKTASLYAEVSRGYEVGIIQGTLDGKALAYEPVTRADVAVMTNRALKLVGSFSKRSALDYLDERDIGRYARDAVAQMKAYELIDNFNGKFKPNQPVTRSEAALIISRVLELINDNKQEDNTVSDDKLTSPNLVNYAITNDWKYEGGHFIFRVNRQGDFIRPVYNLIEERKLVNLANTMLDEERWFNMNYFSYSEEDLEGVSMQMASAEIAAIGGGLIPLQIIYYNELYQAERANNVFFSMMLDPGLYDSIERESHSKAYKRKIKDSLNILFDTATANQFYDFIMNEYDYMHEHSIHHKRNLDSSDVKTKVIGNIKVTFVPSSTVRIYFSFVN